MWIENSALATTTVLNKTDWRIRTTCNICNPCILVMRAIARSFSMLWKIFFYLIIDEGVVNQIIIIIIFFFTVV